MSTSTKNRPAADEAPVAEADKPWRYQIGSSDDWLTAAEVETTRDTMLRDVWNLDAAGVYELYELTTVLEQIAAEAAEAAAAIDLERVQAEQAAAAAADAR